MIYYVNSTALWDGNGKRETPFRQINDAARIAKPGDEVVVAPGIYREYVNPLNGGTKDKRIVYRSEEPFGAVITGAELITGWKKFKRNVWTVKIDNSVFGSYNPYTTVICGDWCSNPAVRHTGAVYLNDQMMYETADLEECLEGAVVAYAWTPEESCFKWYSEQHGNKTILYGNFQGKDPNREKVEITVRRNCFMPSDTGINYITVTGFCMDKAATTWAPPTAYQDGMIGPHWSRGWIIEDCEFRNSKCCGISLGKYYDPDNEMYYYTKHIKEAGQMQREAVCRAQHHGWAKEKIGGHIIRRCSIHHCEQAGIVGHMGGVFSLIEDCHIHHICTSGQVCGCETSGIKLHAAIDVCIRRNHIHNCITGIWCDWQAQGTRITQNLLHNNYCPDGVEQLPGAMFNNDIFIEVSHGPTVIDNNILMSKTSVMIPSQGVACVHNLMLGSFGWINAGVDSIVNNQREPRYTPYHIPHRTELAGFMTILHGDDRIYNNIFVQTWPIAHPERTSADIDYERVGTEGFDIFPAHDEWIKNFMMDEEPDMTTLKPYHFGHLPVWIEGNAYFNGADVSRHENNHLVSNCENVFVELIEREGNFYLNTNLYTYMQKFRSRIITSDILGVAFEPEQRFENPDGSEIIFNRDFFGAHRGIDTLPGPFANEIHFEKKIW